MLALEDDKQGIEKIDLTHPKGNVGYVMKIRLVPDEPDLYVKLELGSGVVFGRSFHYSEVDRGVLTGGSRND